MAKTSARASGMRIIQGVLLIVMAGGGAALSGAAFPQPALAQGTSSRLQSFPDIVDAVKSSVIGVKARVAAAGDPHAGVPGARRGAPTDRLSPFGGPGEEGQPNDQGEFRVPPNLPDEHRVLIAQGSGFFISADGYAVTNAHVVGDNDTAEIDTDDAKTYTAKVVGRDPVSDLALLKVDGKDFTPVRLAERTPRVGDWVLAIGNPFGLGGTVTAGIVSAHHRSVGSDVYDELVQIDAPVNQGNSGGPTFDLDGNVIGVNTMIVSPTGGSIGIAFAIPVETLKTVIPQLRERGSVTRGWLGVQIASTASPLEPVDTLTARDGVTVGEAQPGGPAAKAGIARGDVITSVNDEPVKDAHDLVRRIGSMSPGASVKLGIRRAGEEKSVMVTIGELPATKRPGRAGTLEQAPQPRRHAATAPVRDPSRGRT
jgi:serine protease Do